LKKTKKEELKKLFLRKAVVKNLFKKKASVNKLVNLLLKIKRLKREKRSCEVPKRKQPKGESPAEEAIAHIKTFRN
jgi:hypothetical protein